MIIEDDLDILDIITFILTESGYEVISSSNSSILSAAKNDYPDLILLDNRLPEGLGIEICQRYKQQWVDAGASVCPIIIISADHGVASLAESYGADGFIEKPFEVAGFLAAVNKFAKNF